MLTLACLVTVLALCAMWRLLEAMVRALDIDLMEAMLYLGLAEQDVSPAARRVGSTRPPSRAARGAPPSARTATAAASRAG